MVNLREWGGERENPKLHISLPPDQIVIVIASDNVLCKKGMAIPKTHNGNMQAYKQMKIFEFIFRTHSRVPIENMSELLEKTIWLC